MTVHQSLLKRTLHSRGMMALCTLLSVMVATHFTLNFLCWLSCQVVFKA